MNSRESLEVMIRFSLVGAAVAVPLSLVLVVFLSRAARRAERQRTRQQDATVVVGVMCAFFFVGAGVGACVVRASDAQPPHEALTNLFQAFERSAMRCNAGGFSDYVSPDHGHKIVLFTVVCGGATEDSGVVPEASSAVSLLRKNESVPKHAAGNISNGFLAFHTEADSVSWSDSTHVRVLLHSGPGENKVVRKDGVTVELRTSQ